MCGEPTNAWIKPNCINLNDRYLPLQPASSLPIKEVICFRFNSALELHCIPPYARRAH